MVELGLLDGRQRLALLALPALALAGSALGAPASARPEERRRDEERHAATISASAEHEDGDA